MEIYQTLTFLFELYFDFFQAFDDYIIYKEPLKMDFELKSSEFKTHLIDNTIEILS